MDSGILLNYMNAALHKDFEAVYQLLSGDFEVPLCSPPTAALGVTLQLCSSYCDKYPVLLEKCPVQSCREHGGAVLSLLRAACMDARLTQDGQQREQGSVLALLLLAGAGDLEGARKACGLCYETPSNPVFYCGMDKFPRAVLQACTTPAELRAAAWPRVLRRLAKAGSGEEQEALAREMFLELCCKGTSPAFFEEWKPEKE